MKMNRVVPQMKRGNRHGSILKYYVLHQMTSLSLKLPNALRHDLNFTGLDIKEMSLTPL